MSNTSIIGLLAFITALIAVMAPIIKLNTNLAKLNANFEHLLKSNEVQDEKIEKIIEKQRINEKIIDVHELRIGKLEEKI